jgi:uncharacterized YigZ family protein
MLFSDIYYEPIGTSQANLREKGSKFLAYVFPVKNEIEIKKHLLELRSKYPDATHHCYAWILNPDKSAQRSTDDGEPSNSAGKPILRAIISKDLTNVLVAVVRYFGGTQLGIPGLIQAYGDAAKNALDLCEIKEHFISDYFDISADFANEQEIHRLINSFKVSVIKSEYTDKVIYFVSVRRSNAAEFEKKCKENYLLSISKT